MGETFLVARPLGCLGLLERPPAGFEALGRTVEYCPEGRKQELKVAEEHEG
jgi:hypothetical protein